MFLMDGWMDVCMMDQLIDRSIFADQVRRSWTEV